MRLKLVGVMAGLLALVAAAPAAADHGRPGVPTGLTSTVTGPHFVVHYNASTASTAYAQAGLADFEESYRKLVTGGGGTPNAGLRAPTADSDGKTDVYLGGPTSPGWEGFSGGAVFPDRDHPGVAYVFMSPDLDRKGFRFRAAHEFMHVIQDAYTAGQGVGLATESTANWAADFALPDSEPLDSNFRRPDLPLDCVYGTWRTHPCGNGYRQWLFIQHLVEDYGPDVVDDLLTEMGAWCASGCGPVLDRQILNSAIAAQDPGATLRTRYAAYTRDVIDPTRWQTTAVRAVHDFWGPPAHTEFGQFTTGSTTASIDHLSTRYMRVRNDNASAPSGPNDRISIRITRPGGIAAPTPVLKRAPGAGGMSDHGQPFSSIDSTREIPADPARLSELWVPLANDTEDQDAQSFGFTVAWIRGTPTPPANDVRSRARRVGLGTVAQSNVYAGGRGQDESPCGSFTQDATRGTWYRFEAPNTGRYAVSSRGSDFANVIHPWIGRRSLGCNTTSSGGSRLLNLGRGDDVDVYVGRRSDAQPESGTTVRLAITGPNAPPPAPPVEPDGEEPGVSLECAGAREDYMLAKKSYSRAKKAVRKAKGTRAKKRAKAKLKKAKKRLTRAKRRRDAACP